MTDPFIGEIAPFPYGFTPKGWAPCDGQSIRIDQARQLFSVIGTKYGGDGTTYFNLPDLMDRVPIGAGDDRTGNVYAVGDRGGVQVVTLSKAEMTAHTHRFQVSTRAATERQAPGRFFAVGTGVAFYDANTKATKPMDPNMVTPTGGQFEHNNVMPYQTLQFCISMEGTFPHRPT